MSIQKNEKPKYLLCIGFTSSGEVISGDSNGNLQVWSKGPTRKISRVIEVCIQKSNSLLCRLTLNLCFMQAAHEGPVFSIFATKDFFITGGKDGRVRKWNETFSSTQQTEVIPCFFSKKVLILFFAFAFIFKYILLVIICILKPGENRVTGSSLLLYFPKVFLNNNCLFVFDNNFIYPPC